VRKRSRYITQLTASDEGPWERGLTHCEEKEIYENLAGEGYVFVGRRSSE